MRVEEGAPLYNRNSEPMVIHKATMDRLLTLEKPADAIALYSFYYYTAKWQNTTKIKAVESYCLKALKFGRPAFRKAKKSLKKLGLISDIQCVEKNKIKAHYVLVNFVSFGGEASFIDQESHTSENCLVGGDKNTLETASDKASPHTSENCLMEHDSHTAEFELVQKLPTNALNTNSLNALNTDKKKRARSKFDFKAVLQSWNSIAQDQDSVSEINLISDSRKAAIKSRHKDLVSVRKDLLEVEPHEALARLFAYLVDSDWLMGRVTGSNGKCFKLTFDWLFKPTNFVKVMEGNYHDS